MARDSGVMIGKVPPGPINDPDRSPAAFRGTRFLASGIAGRLAL
ncbi:hypothetical protein BIWAKO_05428 [Bosea sp. BIWAKO-01]|nr:hypothetical protein BIWAKO_05428 [Bosea sp. BIWAKO-01]